MALAVATAALAQDPGGDPGTDPDDSLAKILTNAEKAEQRKKDADRPPLEFSRSQVLPNDVLPYIKANHWSMFALEMRANLADYDGILQADPVRLADQPQEVTFRREARLVKGQRTRLTVPVLVPAIPKEIPFRLIRPESIREDEKWLASCRLMDPHQQLVVVLTRGANDAYQRWNSLRATTPTGVRVDDQEMERARYYRLVLPLEPDKPLLAAHPLTWSPISHVIWDGLEPEKLNVAQQQAMLDWLHWGGQLVIVGGAGPSFAPLRESFLAPYLPAVATGDNVSRTGDQLSELARAYPPVAPSVDPLDAMAGGTEWEAAWEQMGRRYRAPEPILTSSKKPLFVASLRPRNGATVIPLGGADDPPLGVEWRVGRGRVLMLAVSLTDPDLVGWRGFDTLLRRVVLRRPEESVAEPLRYNGIYGGGFLPPRYNALTGPDLTSVRYLARDLGAPNRTMVDPDNFATPSQTNGAGAIAKSAVNPRSIPQGFFNQPTAGTAGATVTQVPVAEWLDSAEMPRLSREVLEEASGIEIPNSWFVLRVIVAYIVALVPLNWLLCRYVLGRREWAWAIAPVLALVVAVGVERAAAYDVGYDSSCDEVDLLETHGNYPRGHLSRFASLYSTGRLRYSISYPNDATALALPMSTSGALRGEEAAQSTFQALPTPELAGFQVQPRSLALFRVEQMKALPGTVALEAGTDGASRVIRNRGGIDLKEAWLVEVRPEGDTRAALVGDLEAGAAVPVPTLENAEPESLVAAGKLTPRRFLDLLHRSAVATRPEEVGELRLIAWHARPVDGQQIDPPVDRHRGFTLVVAHLTPGRLPDPNSPRYSAVSRSGVEPTPPEPARPAEPPPGGMSPYTMYGRGRAGVNIVPPTPAPVPAPAPAPTPAPESPQP